VRFALQRCALVDHLPFVHCALARHGRCHQFTGFLILDSLLPLDLRCPSVEIVGKVFEAPLSSLIGDRSRQPSSLFSVMA